MMETESHVRCWQPETPPVAQRPAGDLGTAYRLQELADNPTKPVTAGDITQACCHICELTGVGEREIREVVPSCTRARRQLSNSAPVANRPCTELSGWWRQF